MPDRTVNYDQVAPTYNHRFAGQKQRPTAAALDALAREIGATATLEVGCGTGRWLADLRASQAVDPGCLFGLDRSYGMLAQARDQFAGLQIVQGLAEQLPFPRASFDLIYCVNALHHFSRPEWFIRQAFRLLQPGGWLAIIGMDPRNFLATPERPSRGRWYVYEYFEGTLALDLGRFPSWDQVQAWMTEAGLETIRLQPVERVHDSKTGAEVWSDPFLAKNSTSQLILLTDEEYQAGLDRMQAALTQAEAIHQVLIFPVDLLIDMLVARKPDIEL